MNPHFSSGIVGALTAIIVGAGAYYVAPAKQTVQVVRPALMQVGKTPVLKVVRNAWSELSQEHVDALTAALGKIEKRPVTIICANQIWCADLQLDLDNSFESAHWTTSFDTLIFGDQVGITASDEDLAKVIGDATGLTIKVDTSYRERLEMLAKIANAAPERKAQIIIGRNAEK